MGGAQLEKVAELAHNNNNNNILLLAIAEPAVFWILSSLLFAPILLQARCLAL